MAELIAICGDKPNLNLKLVPMSDSLQISVEETFKTQETVFRAQCTERFYNQDWRVDDEEIAYISLPTSTTLFSRLLTVPPTNLHTVHVEADNIKALALKLSENGFDRVLFQRFTKSQLLRQKLTFFLSKGTFTVMDNAAFQLGERLFAIVEGGMLKFKNLNILRGILDTTEIMREATDEELQLFLSNSLFETPEAVDYFALVDSVVRNKVLRIQERGVLERLDVNKIVERARNAGVAIEVRNDAIVLPADRRQLKEFVKFLNDERYIGPASERLMETNSCRPVDD